MDFASLALSNFNTAAGHFPDSPLCGQCFEKRLHNKSLAVPHLVIQVTELITLVVATFSSVCGQKSTFSKSHLASFPQCADVETCIRTVFSLLNFQPIMWLQHHLFQSCQHTPVTCLMDKVLKSHHLSPSVTSCLDFFPSTILSGSPCYSGRLVNTNP